MLKPVEAAVSALAVVVAGAVEVDPWASEYSLGDAHQHLGDLIGDLGLGDLANVSVEPLGGFDTLLVDVVPQQILAALGM